MSTARAMEPAVMSQPKKWSLEGSSRCAMLTSKDPTRSMAACSPGLSRREAEPAAAAARTMEPWVASSLARIISHRWQTKVLAS